MQRDLDRCDRAKSVAASAEAVATKAFPQTSNASAPAKLCPRRRTSLDGRHPYQGTIGRYRWPRGFWRGRYDWFDAVIILVSRWRGSCANAHEANGWYRNCRRRCVQTHPCTSVNDGGPSRLGSDMMPIMINASIDRHFFRKACMFRAIIDLSPRAMRLRQSGGTDQSCGDSQRKNAIGHILVLPRFSQCPTIMLEFWLYLTAAVWRCANQAMLLMRHLSRWVPNFADLSHRCLE